MKTKPFDCVEMKRQIQERLLKEDAALSASQRRARADERIEADPILGPVWRSARPVPRAAVKPKPRG
ncbi:MAG: hypothetical protein HZA51_09335 [Planctomycetes bacterium]|nr:hypothetical protein [Planctomycetota bacterium]